MKNSSGEELLLFFFVVTFCEKVSKFMFEPGSKG